MGVNELIYQGSFMKDALKRVSNPNQEMNTVKKYECDVCKDTGYIAITIHGKEKPSLDVGSLDLESIRLCVCKRKKDAEASLKNSGIDLSEYKSKSLETFRRDTDLAERMYDMATSYLNDDEAKGIGYFGKSGTGKTHICIAICNELSRRGIIHKYFNYRKDIQILKSLAFDQEEYNKKLSQYLTVPVLYIDDFLKLAKSSNGGMNMQELQIAYDLINTRAINKKPIIISSEYTVSEMIDIDEAIGSRIYQMVIPYGMKCAGENRRFDLC